MREHIKLNRMKKKPPRDLIIDMMKEKTTLKNDVFDVTYELFHEFKEVFKELTNDLTKKVTKADQRIIIEFKDKGEFESELKIGGDILIFNMHTNVFDFDKSHGIWRSSYLHDDPSRSYCGMISVYNFLSDSFKYNRGNDVGYLIARIFINKDKHFFVEGKRQLGFLYNDFSKAVLDKSQITAITESAILYCLDFDLLTPPYDTMKQASVLEMQEWSSTMQIKTGKRVGFKFQADGDEFM